MISVSSRSVKVFRKLSLLGPCRLRFFSQQLVATKNRRESIQIPKKPCRPPFMKNTFVGIFDTEMLVYPEFDKSGLQELKQELKPYKDYVKVNVDPSVIFKLGTIPSEVNENFKSLGLFGQIIPTAYGGYDLTATETALISEIVAQDLDVAMTLYSHNFLGAQTLVMYGNEQQKDKFLPQLATGEKVVAFCLSENVSSSDLTNLKTCLEPSVQSQDTYILNGEKLWVTNARNANLFLVFAQCSVRTHTGRTIPLIKIALVDRDSPGVTVSQTVEHVGLTASGICEVQFKDTPVSSDCLIGDEFKGFEMATSILNNGRYNIGAITLSVLKLLLNKATEFIVSRNQFSKPLIENELIQSKCSDVARCIYALESMTYHTTGILDKYENPDCSLELAIIKVFSFTEGRKSLDIIMELMGGRACLNSEITQKYFRDFRTMETFDGTIDIANLYISLVGLQHAGHSNNETISKLRFPYQYPEFVLKYIFRTKRQIGDKPKLTMKLYEQLHPSLIQSANELEYCVLRLQYAVSVFFGRYGSDVINQQLELMRIADVAVKIYVMTCVLGRSSRSYCIGLPNAETEIKYAATICTTYKKRVQESLNDLIDGFIISGDLHPMKQGRDILHHHGYFLEHPLQRSY